MRALTDAELDVVSGGERKKPHHNHGRGVLVIRDVQVAVDTGDIELEKVKFILPHAEDVNIVLNTGNIQ